MAALAGAPLVALLRPCAVKIQGSAMADVVIA